MLRIVVPEQELFDEATETFHLTKEQTLSLEHSLVSISKWESKWKKPFLSDDNKSPDEILDYIRCMTLTQNVDPMVYRSLTPENIKEVTEYINDKMTATWFSENTNKRHDKRVITSEVIYGWMISLSIPMECQKWHINRLLTLVRVCNEMNTPPKQMSKREIMARNNALNMQRRARMHSRG